MTALLIFVAAFFFTVGLTAGVLCVAATSTTRTRINSLQSNAEEQGVATK